MGFELLNGICSGRVHWEYVQVMEMVEMFELNQMYLNFFIVIFLFSQIHFFCVEFIYSTSLPADKFDSDFCFMILRYFNAGGKFNLS